MEVIKQPDLQVFASSAKSGEVLKFPDILRGWGVTLDQTQGKPPLEWMNDAFKRIDLNILYQLQQGIPTWNKSVRYPKDAVVKNDGKIYMCLVENENNDPNLSSDKWSLLIKKATTAQAGITQLTSALSDREDLSATPKMVNDVNRATKAAQTAANQANDKANTAQSRADSAYNLGNTANGNANTRLEKSKNLSDLANTAVARNNLGLGNSATLSTTSTLSDRTDQVATPKMVNDVHRAASTAQKAANTANDKANSAISEANKKRDLSDNTFDAVNGLGLKKPGNQNYSALLRAGALSENYNAVLHQYGGKGGEQLSGSIIFDRTENGTAATREWVKSASIGIDQKWIDVTEQRFVDVAYANNTGRPIFAVITLRSTSANIGGDAAVTIDNVQFKFGAFGSNGYGGTASIIIPAGSNYKVTNMVNSVLSKWIELR